MPVQIDELIITATVNPQAATNGSGRTLPQVADSVTEKLIAEKVLEIINAKNER